ncbi:DUF92 domain-containing protein [Thermosediminibacter oceani]|uniref:DUF92 domain-containing protein n=1 Tax=Thermosediminibacter oceani (strain ATCC BAA-1034 / DSM 16646 / JW/IW-1228P) TaxID=555079 RepID=D9S1G2_THEOJ|nr:DUF92 domain-containing protein [Thermosediminibacter oceani]ADL07239.1 protein of unknown function DUF92 transmembrane [Thermosediminibacter oceani DSM 16646]
MKDFIGVVISILFVFGVIIISEVLRKAGGSSAEVTRKFVHIGVSHWWPLAMFLIDDIRYALIPPALFVAVNYYSHKKNVFKGMERKGASSDLGTVYFPVSLIVLILLTWDGGLLGRGFEYLGLAGVLAMGYGDGLAAIVGWKFGKSKYRAFKSEKSLEGSVTMLAFSFIAIAVALGSFLGFTPHVLRVSFVAALIATISEALSPSGTDNLTVPVVTSLASNYFLYILKNSNLFLFIYMAGIGFVLSFFIAYAAYRKNSLTLDGSVGATILGTMMYATSGIFGSFLMVLFFISSSLLSYFKKSAKSRATQSFDKTGCRDVFQVLANGGVGLLYSVLYYITKNPSYLVLLAVSFAAANADTWATELGILSKARPISLRTFRRVEKGTSGAVSLSGTLAALMGALLIGISAAAGFKLMDFGDLAFTPVQSLLMVTLGGFLGSLIDSILGATLQGVYYSEELEGETEKRFTNGKPNRLVRGLGFVNNDLVNFLSIGLSSALFAGII